MLPVLRRDALTDPADDVILYRLACMLATLLAAVGRRRRAARTGIRTRHRPAGAVASAGRSPHEPTSLSTRPDAFQHATAIMGVDRATVQDLLAHQDSRVSAAWPLLDAYPGWADNHVVLPGTGDAEPGADGPPYPSTPDGPLTLTGAAPATPRCPMTT